MRREVLALSEAEAQDPSLTGHKAATLARLTARGVRVPPGFVITADVFSASASPLLDSVSSQAARADPADLKTLAEIEAQASKAIVGLTLSAQLMDAIGQARQTLGAPAVSVRSSATAEDMPGASFAGQYESFLNVISLHDVTECLVRVWASTYSTRAIAYRLRSGVAGDGVKMAVLVQEQLDPDAAGVLFTRDPVSRAPQYVVIAALGLGEGVVSGTAPADRYVLEPGSGKVLASEIAAKEAMFSLESGGGIQRTRVPGNKNDKPALGTDALKALASLGGMLEDFLNGPQDVEFALAGGELYCLQSRPITALGDEPEVDVDWEGAVDGNYRWELSSMSLFKGPLFPLQEDVATAYAAGLRTCFDETGRDLPRMCVMQVIEGYAYLRAPDVDAKTLSDRQARHAARCQEYISRGTSHYEENIVPKVDETLRDLRSLRYAGSSVTSRLRYLEAAIEAAGLVMGHLHWCMTGGDRRDWRTAFADITGEPQENADAIVGAISNMTTRLVARLRKLARVVQEDPVLADLFAKGQYGLLDEPSLGTTPAAREFRAGFKRLLRVYGFRTGWGFGSGTGFETPTWNMEPERPLRLIASYAAHDLDEMERVEAGARRTRVRETRRVQRRLAREPERLARFEAARATAWEEIVRMEDHNHLMEQCTVGQMRQAMFDMGASMVRQGLIEDANDVLHISLAELREVAAGDRPRDLRELVRARSEERARRGLLNPPESLGKAADTGAATPGTTSGEGFDGHVIRGTPASQGVATGPARLMKGGEPPEALQRGDVLVADNVGPNMTPFFPLLGGLVLDGGAIYQHAALVAREYRLPTVILTRDATATVREGQLITVDGSRGVVELDR